MPDRRRELGRRGEALAAKYLTDRGYEVVGKNVRTPSGEIDLVAWKDGGLVFVEVRAKTGEAFGLPEESITPDKKRRMVESAEAYLQGRNLTDVQWRLDVVAIEMDSSGRARRIDLVENAVTP